MGLFQKGQKKGADSGVCAVQTGRISSHPFYELNAYTPLNAFSNRIYYQLREAIPIIDAAISKIIRLSGGFKIETENEKTNSFINDYLNKINVSGNMVGINSFVDSYLEQLLTCGTAIGEMLISDGELVALYNGELDCVDVKRNGNSIDLEFYNTASSSPQKIEFPQLILFSVLNPEPGKILGNSILKGLPYISDILLKIYNTIGNNWERVGNLRYAVTYKPQGDSSDRTFAKERAAQMANQWRDAMQSDSVKDFVAVGDVNVQVIGSDNQVLDSEIPVRQLLEQIVAKTGIPPFMIGLSWSSTERMSEQQVDILTTELESYRRILTPVIEKISNTALVLNGFSPNAKVIWDDITLLDQTEMAKARLYNVQADKILREVEA